MVTEIAQIDVAPGTEREFEAGVAKARELFGRARGFKSLALHRSIEKPQRYRLVIEWETLENHTVASMARTTGKPGARWSRIALRARPRSSTPTRC
jgi:heme-degrading monooxygenase HmoA